MPIPPAPPLDETINPGQTGHIADHEAIHEALNNDTVSLTADQTVTGHKDYTTDDGLQYKGNTVVTVNEGPLSLLDPRIDADNSGATDISAAWDAALALIPNGGELYGPPGTYKAESKLVLRRMRGVKLRGASRYATKFVGSGLGADPLFSVESCRDTSFESLYADGGGTTAAIIDSTRLDGASFSGRNLRVKDAKIGGDAAGSAAYGVRIGTGFDANQDIMVLDDIELAHLDTAIFCTSDGVGKNSYLHMFSNLAFSTCDVGIDAIGYSLVNAEFEGTDLFFRCRANREATKISNIVMGDNGLTPKILDIPADAEDGGSVFMSNIWLGVGSLVTPVNVVNIDPAVDNWSLFFENLYYQNGTPSANCIFEAPGAGNRMYFGGGNVLNMNINTAGTVVWGPGNFTTQLPYAGLVITGGGRVESRSNDVKFGPSMSRTMGKMNTVASAAGTITLPPGEFIEVTGTAAITSITADNAATGGDIGRTVVLKFASTASLVDGSNLKLAGNFPGGANSTITLVCDGTNWYETARSVN